MEVKVLAVEVGAVARKLADMVINASHLRLFNDLYAVEKTTRMTFASQSFHSIQIIDEHGLGEKRRRR